MDLTEAHEVLKSLEGCAEILGEVGAERWRQHSKWGEQNWEDGTGHRAWAVRANAAKDTIRYLLSQGKPITFQDIMHEEVCEAFAESDPEKLRAELIQVAAVAIQWAEAIDRRACKDCGFPNNVHCLKITENPPPSYL